MKITPEQVCEALDAWVCRPGMTQEQATILITEAFWALKERPNIDVQRVTFDDGAVERSRKRAGCQRRCIQLWLRVISV